MHDVGTLDLLDEEREHLARINFKASYRDGTTSVDAAALLMALLVERDAIPPRRARYFLDPVWGVRGKSRRQVFEDNGTRGTDIYAHGNFLKYLRFFVHGPNLPPAVVSAMREQVGDPQWFGGSDIQPLVALARKLARAHGLDAESDEAFMQLGADLELSADHAAALRRAVRSIRR